LAFWKVGWAVFTWFSAYWILEEMIHYSRSREMDEKSNAPKWKGHLLAVSMLLSSALASFCFHQLTVQSTKIGVRVCRSRKNFFSFFKLHDLIIYHDNALRKKEKKRNS